MQAEPTAFLPTSRNRRWLDPASRGIAGSLAVAGAVMGLAWMTGLQHLMRLHPASTLMQFVTALLFVACGAGLEGLRRQRRSIVTGAAWVVLAIAGATLWEYAASPARGFDLLFPAEPATRGLAYPGRMAGNTAVAFVLASLAMLLLADAQRRARRPLAWIPAVAAMLATLVVTLGALAVLGYAAGLPEAMEWSGLSRMALMTALLFVALGAGLLIEAIRASGTDATEALSWLPATTGAGLAMLSLLGWHALRAQVPAIPADLDQVVLILGFGLSALLAASLAQLRQLRLQTRALAAANAALGAAKTEVEDLYEYAPCGYHTLDRDGRFLRANATECQWLGYRRSEMTGGMRLQDILSERSRRLYFAKMPQFLLTGELRDLELELLRKDGSELPVLVNAVAVRDAAGRFQFSRSSLFDITERRRATRERALLAAIVEQTDDAIITIALDGTVTSWNGGAERLFGVAARDVLGQSLGALIPADRAEEYAAAFEQIRAGRAVPGYETTRRHHDGSVLAVSVTMSPLRDAGGRVAGASKIVRDISSHKRIETALRESEQRAQALLLAAQQANAELQRVADQRQIFAALVENSSDFIGIADPAGGPVYVNPAGLRMVGLAPDARVAQTRISEYYTEEQRERAVREIVPTMTERGYWKGETEFRHWQTNAAIPVSDEHFLIRDPSGGRVLGMGTITRDITDMRKAHDEVQRANERLRQANVEITQLNRELGQQRNRLAEAQAAGHVGSWEFNPQERTLHWSDETFRIFGLPPSAIAPSYAEFIARIAPADRARVEREIRQSLEQHSAFDLEHRIALPDGSTRVVHEWGQAYAGAEGASPRMVGTCQDVTERRAADEWMRQASTVFAATNEGIIVADADARIVSVNQAFVRITGYAVDAVLGQNPRLLHSGRHEPGFYAALWATLNATGQWEGEMWNRRQNGEVFPVWQNISAVRAADGRVTHYVSIFADISQSKAAEARLEHLAHHDTLTGLANRALFSANLESSLQRAHRHGHRSALLLLDLDRFKIINDTLGHASGDLMLQEAAQRLKAVARAEDTVARLGGDEFAIIAESLAAPGDATPLAVKIIEALSRPMTIEGRTIRTSASVGIGVYPDDAKDAADLMRVADAAMYRAKARGRNTYDYYTAELSAQAAGRLALETALHRALERDELMLYYQPQAEVQGGRIVGVEALLRWNHPERGMLMPDQFVGVAEESNLIDAIGEWALNAAIDQAAQWAQDGLPLRRISVNVSGRQIIHDRVAQSVTRALARHGHLPNSPRLELEITENVLLAHERSALVLQQLHDCGARIAIDDFGIGYSSLSSLRHLCVDTLKIDRSFVRGLPMAADARAIAAAIIAMGHSLDLHVVAEGVETGAQFELLSTLGCDEVQGFLIAAPMPADQFADLLRRHPCIDLPGGRPH